MIAVDAFSALRAERLKRVRAKLQFPTWLAAICQALDGWTVGSAKRGTMIAAGQLWGHFTDSHTKIIVERSAVTHL